MRLSRTVPSRRHPSDGERPGAQTSGRSASFVAAWMLVGLAGIAGAFAQVSDERAKINAPASLTLDFEPNLPLVVLEAKGPIGDYQGAYLLMERTDRQLFQMHSFRSNDVSHACIYKAVDHTANFGHQGHAGYEQREPDPLVTPYWQPLDEFDQFVSSSSDRDFFDPQNGIASRLDLDNAIDFHLLVLLTSNLDGITKNFIIARHAPGSGLAKPRFFFSPWDYDGTFGRNWDASLVGPAEWLSNHLFDRLMRDRAYRDRFARRWKELREREFSTTTIQGMIETNAQTLGAAARRNAIRWRDAAGYYPDQLAFAEDVRQMKAWIEARARWLDGEIQRRNLSPQ